MTSKKSRTKVFGTDQHMNLGNSPKDFKSSDSNYFIRAELEREYQIKYQQLKQIYETRVQALSEGVKDAFRLIQNDDLIDTMRQDRTSEEFVNQRVKEIIEECINSDRESLMERLSHEVAELRGEYVKLEQENSKVKFKLKVDFLIK